MGYVYVDKQGVPTWIDIGGWPLDWLWDGPLCLTFHGGNNSLRGCDGEYPYSLSVLEE